MRDGPQFYLTSPSPCPYLPGHDERKVFTHLVGVRAKPLNDALTHSGFRRSQTIAYRPACENCRACVSVRVLVNEFRLGKSFRRVLETNQDVAIEARQPEASREQYNLFSRYLTARHQDGGMVDMSVVDYATMLEDTHVDTRAVEYRRVATSGPGELLGMCITDILSDGLSMVYSFYDPNEERRSFGTYMILDHIERAKRLNLPYLYLGYWVDGSPKMAYKSRFLPQQRLVNSGWLRFDR
jgi:arginyl-tRNA--protein-N-Asp/Glu arginylyltransferase